MQIMTILGSPRRQGNTAKILSRMHDRFKVGGFELDAVSMLDYPVRGCIECMACKKGAVELCSIDDDANDLYRRMAKSDLVLFAAPMFCWGFPAQLKTLIDRMFCLMQFDSEWHDAPRLVDKPIALLLTAGEQVKSDADLVVRSFEKVVEYVHGRFAGSLFVPDCVDPDAIGEDEMQRAVAFAEALIDTVKAAKK